MGFVGASSCDERFPSDGWPRAELDFHGQDALILVGQKRRGHTPQDPARAHEHGQIYDHHPAADLDDPADGPPVGRGRPVETPDSNG